MLAIIGTMTLVFVSRSKMFAMVAVLLAGIVGISIVATKYPSQSTAFIQNVLVKHHLLQSFQANRFITWLNPNYDLSGAGYNVHQTLTAVASGELYGEGLFRGMLTDGNFIPNQWTDFIFTVIAEEFGFIGSVLLIFSFLLLISRLIKIANESQDQFGMYMIVGFIGMFAFQVFENIGMNYYLSPATGITLPFISYGGSSLVANYLCIGIALSVALRRKSLSFR
jgi:rod shape determining protein RodA